MNHGAFMWRVSNEKRGAFGKDHNNAVASMRSWLDDNPIIEGLASVESVQNLSRYIAAVQQAGIVFDRRHILK